MRRPVPLEQDQVGDDPQQIAGEAFDVGDTRSLTGRVGEMKDRLAGAVRWAATTCLVIENGEVAMTGTSKELSHDPRVRQIYLGL